MATNTKSKELGLTKHSYFSLSLSRSELPNYRFSYETIKNSQELIDLVEFFNNQPEDQIHSILGEVVFDVYQIK